MAVAITRTDYDAVGLRQAASHSKDADAARRMLAIAMVLDGHSRAAAAETCGMDRQTLRDWVHCYNDEGLPGLADRKPPGAKPRLSPEQQQALADLVRSGPDPSEHGVIRWRRIDLSRLIETRFGVQLAERSVGALLWRMGFRHVSLGPQNPAQDPAAVQAYKKTSPTWSPQPYPSMRAASRSSSGGRTRPESASKAP
jgi:transposase